MTFAWSEPRLLLFCMACSKPRLGLGTKRILHSSGKAPHSFVRVFLRKQAKTSYCPWSVCNLTFVSALIGGGTSTMQCPLAPCTNPRKCHLGETFCMRRFQSFTESIHLLQQLLGKLISKSRTTYLVLASFCILGCVVFDGMHLWPARMFSLASRWNCSQITNSPCFWNRWHRWVWRGSSCLP